MIYIGTSGFSYDDWVGPVYPAALAKSDWLAYYAREFNAVELNASYYRMPDARTLEAMAAKTSPGFRFTLKAHQSMTHSRDADAAAYAAFVQALAPWREREQLGAVLAQFPPSFAQSEANMGYLETLGERFGDLPLVVEVRHRSWIEPAFFERLRQVGLGYCCVDQPRFRNLVPPLAEATASPGYVRFHGRNAQKWWRHEQAWERYDYRYSRQELQPWAQRAGELEQEVGTAYLFANNHWQGQAVDTARQLRMLLEGDRMPS
ncbi:MAG: DUF72 domain-containing protein [Anaerolineae bacterium]